MDMLLYLVFMAVAIAQFVYFIMVLIKLFQNEGALWGILGLICGLYTLIWGWMNADKYNIRKTMMIWTILIVAQLVLYFLVFGRMMSSGMVPTTN